MTETDTEFILRTRDCYGSLTGRERDRLFDIASRAAAMQKLVGAVNTLIDFHNGPAETKRPDVFILLMQNLANALGDVGEPRQ